MSKPQQQQQQPRAHGEPIHSIRDNPSDAGPGDSLTLGAIAGITIVGTVLFFLAMSFVLVRLERWSSSRRGISRLSEPNSVYAASGQELKGTSDDGSSVQQQRSRRRLRKKSLVTAEMRDAEAARRRLASTPSLPPLRTSGFIIDLFMSRNKDSRSKEDDGDSIPVLKDSGSIGDQQPLHLAKEAELDGWRNMHPALRQRSPNGRYDAASEDEDFELYTVDTRTTTGAERPAATTPTSAPREIRAMLAVPGSHSRNTSQVSQASLISADSMVPSSSHRDSIPLVPTPLSSPPQTLYAWDIHPALRGPAGMGTVETSSVLSTLYSEDETSQ